MSEQWWQKKGDELIQRLIVEYDMTANELYELMAERFRRENVVFLQTESGEKGAGIIDVAPEK